MKNILSINLLLILAVLLSSCVTGGFDENEQLDDMNRQLALTPKVKSVMVNGEEVERDTHSRRVVDARIGDALDFDVQLTSGSDAQLEELEFFRVYYYGEDFQEDPKPVDPNTNGFYEITGKTHDFTYTYTVPDKDDDDHAFEPGYTIQVFFRVKNSLGNYGYRSIEVHIVE